MWQSFVIKIWEISIFCCFLGWRWVLSRSKSVVEMAKLSTRKRTVIHLCLMRQRGIYLQLCLFSHGLGQIYGPIMFASLGTLYIILSSSHASSTPVPVEGTKYPSLSLRCLTRKLPLCICLHLNWALDVESKFMVVFQALIPGYKRITWTSWPPGTFKP